MKSILLKNSTVRDLGYLLSQHSSFEILEKVLFLLYFLKNTFL